MSAQTTRSPNDAPVVRRATADDRPAIVGLLDRLRDTTHAPDAAQDTHLFSCDQCHMGIVAATTDAVVGYGRWIRSTPTAPRADMAVVVATEWEHRGIGTAILAKLRREAHRAGITRLELRLASRPELIGELADHGAPAQPRVEEGSVVFGLAVTGVIAGQERAAMRWAGESPRHVVGPAVGEPPPRPPAA